MTPDDVPCAEEISADAFHAVDLARRRPADPEPQRRTRENGAGWIARTRKFVATDPDGCWVAEGGDGVLGFATSFRREDVWCLATFAVRPGHQGAGIGSRLLAAALAYGEGCGRRMLAASDDPAATRSYHRAGFRLHPQLTLTGAVDRAALPAVTGLRDGVPDDLAWMDDLDRSLRGGPHGPDHEPLMGVSRLVVAADRTGYAYTNASGPGLIAARDEATARTLLWECLAGTEGRAEVAHVTTANDWAVDVGIAARLDLGTRGYLGLRGMAPPAPYVHHGAVL
jgi:GNAT superfamily N-acetyltransferase